MSDRCDADRNVAEDPLMRFDSSARCSSMIFKIQNSQNVSYYGVRHDCHPHFSETRDTRFRQTVVARSLTNSTCTGGTVTVVTTPVAGKKPQQRKHQRNEREHKSVKAARIERCKSDSDSEFM